MYAGYIARNYGMRNMLAQASQFFWPFFSRVHTNEVDQVGAICSLQYFNKEMMPSHCRKALGLDKEEESE